MNRILLAALLGGVLLSAPTFFFTKSVYQRATLAAEKETAQLKTALATARADLLSKSNELNALLLEDRNAQLAKLDGVVGGLDDLTRRVSLCASKSDVRVTLTPTGVIEAPRDEQYASAQRDLAEVVGDFARACAFGRDRDAIEHNSLVDWVERIKKMAEESNR